MMNSNNKSALKQFTKELSVLHYAMTIGVSMMAAVIYFFTLKNGQFILTDTNDIFMYICPLIAIVGVYFGNFLSRKKIEEIDENSAFDEKLKNYREAKILNFALIEGPALICIIASMNTQNLTYLVIAIVLIIYLLRQSVSEDKILDELGI